MNTNVVNIYIIKQDIHINILPIDGQTAGPDGLNFLENPWVPQVTLAKKILNFFLYKIKKKLLITFLFLKL